MWESTVPLGYTYLLPQKLCEGFPMLYQEVRLFLSEIINLIRIHVMVSKISEDTHELGVVVVDFIPFGNLQHLVSVAIRVLI